MIWSDIHIHEALATPLIKNYINAIFEVFHTCFKVTIIHDLFREMYWMKVIECRRQGQDCRYVTYFQVSQQNQA